MDLELSVFVAFVVVVNGLLIFAMSRVGRRKTGKVTYYPPENRFTEDQAIKAYRLTHDEWIFRKLMLLDIETSHVLAVSTGEDFEELVRTYEKEAPKYETPLEPHKIAVVPVWGSKYPTPWERET